MAASAAEPRFVSSFEGAFAEALGTEPERVTLQLPVLRPGAPAIAVVRLAFTLRGPYEPRQPTALDLAATALTLTRVPSSSLPRLLRSLGLTSLRYLPGESTYHTCMIYIFIFVYIMVHAMYHVS